MTWCGERGQRLAFTTAMPDITLRTMTRDDWAEVADLIMVSTNTWYQTHHRDRIFQRSSADVQLFCQVYEALDPGCCVLAVSETSGRIAGSCFYHPRPTHVSLGIMNVHPNYFGLGVGRRLLTFIIDFAEKRGLPMRLVSSAMNLDSFSLYNRAGFTPRMTFQDMYIAVPDAGLSFDPPGLDRVRDATPDDAPAMAALEHELVGITRENDYRYFIENRDGVWHASVYEEDDGSVAGFLVSIGHTATNMLGPGVMRKTKHAAALIHAELNAHPGRSPVFLVPAQNEQLVRLMYDWSARNCEIHFAQSRGPWQPPTGVVMPTFMPETG